MKSLLAIALVLLPALAQARLHETPEQCAKRYGSLGKSERGPGWEMAAYSKDAISTTCWFREGKCVAIAYQLLAPDRIEANNARFTSAQIDALMIANTGSKTITGIEGEDFPVLQSEDRQVKICASDRFLIFQLFSDIEFRKSLVAEAAVSKTLEGF